MTLAERYERLCQTPADINEHLPTLRAYAERCDAIAELGVQFGKSTTAFLMGQPRYLFSVDLCLMPELTELNPGLSVREAGTDGFVTRVNGVLWEFRLADSRTVELPEPVDLLLIDSEHHYEQVRAELAAHSSRVKHWLIFHDTVAYGEQGVAGLPGINGAIREFMGDHPEWREVAHFRNNNGLQILERQL